MPVSFTSEQIIALAPDDASAKAGRGLASISKWETTGSDERAVWGECRGSGKNPYQVSIDLSEPAFKCSCPSRKFPCKHALGLFLLYTANQIKPAASPPAFCAEWLAKRAAHERKKEKSETELTPEETAKRVKAREKRLVEREAKVAAGLLELELWLKDLIRQGLAAAQSQSIEYWEKMARRLVDVQSPNAARLLREMSSANYQTTRGGKDRTENLLERIGKIYLIAESWKRINELPAPVQSDVRAAVGFSVKEDELQNAETIHDDWQTLGVRVYDEDKLRVQRVWLYGEKSGREALILNFAFQNQPLDASFSAGTKFAAKLAFYPGNFPLRAVLHERAPAPAQNFSEIAGHQNFTEFLGAYSSALAKNIWLETFPARLSGVFPVPQENFWFLRDRDGNLLPIDPNFAGAWKLFAVCGNRPANLFAEWNGETLLPLAAWTENQLLRF